MWLGTSVAHPCKGAYNGHPELLLEDLSRAQPVSIGHLIWKQSGLQLGSSIVSSMLWPIWLSS